MNDVNNRYRGVGWLVVSGGGRQIINVARSERSRRAASRVYRALRGAVLALSIAALSSPPHARLARCASMRRSINSHNDRAM